jgi:hypothetical protein
MSPYVLPPPTLDYRDSTHVWVNLPAANRQRLLWLLSQLVERQLVDSEAQGEDEHESAPGE